MGDHIDDHLSHKSCVTLVTDCPASTGVTPRPVITFYGLPEEAIASIHKGGATALLFCKVRKSRGKI